MIVHLLSSPDFLFLFLAFKICYRKYSAVHPLILLDWASLYLQLQSHDWDILFLFSLATLGSHG